MENSKIIGVAQILQQLKDGMTRDEIGVYYGLKKSEVTLLFKDARLKGKKTIKKKVAAFTLVDDAGETDAVKEVEVTVEPTLTLLVDDATDATVAMIDEITEEEEEEVEEVEVEKASWD